MRGRDGVDCAATTRTGWLRLWVLNCVIVGLSTSFIVYTFLVSRFDGTEMEEKVLQLRCLTLIIAAIAMRCLAYELEGSDKAERRTILGIAAVSFTLGWLTIFGKVEIGEPPSAVMVNRDSSHVRRGLALHASGRRETSSSKKK
jgi:DMSO/TMAO reductase YedYZ heme-binding membrane subunit